MAKITTQDIKKLRQATGARVMDCKKALTEAKGDFQKAQELVKAKGLARAEKKTDRQTKAGLIGNYVHTNGQIAALVELGCETDFVAQNQQFKKLAKQLAMQIVAMNPQDLKELLTQESIHDAQQTVAEQVKALSGKIGEKMEIKRFSRLAVGESA
ncbi:MAG: translation elongation factor Ts [Candidatus Pacebacteria bacterium]|nr:translation elongation factor Ts [Candidatus Paceibacterota bacterium]